MVQPQSSAVCFLVAIVSIKQNLMLLWFSFHTLGNIACFSYDRFTHDWKMHTTCKCIINQNQTISQDQRHTQAVSIYCKSGNVLEWYKIDSLLLETADRSDYTVNDDDDDDDETWIYIAHRHKISNALVAAIPMSLSDLQGHSANASVF